MTKALSTAGKMQGEILRQVGCSQCAVSKCLARQVIWTQEMWLQDDWELAKLVYSDQFQNCGEIAQQWNADVPAS